ncbi:hypothetical protein [Chryseobacterium sp.]|uniref:hypothetical protein n=1 Tax=Chryseobacterium sp. TaxID=1871047 RepID=UPI0025B986CD|nr:hypothetical protein [Chryseobacterium sp.]
MNLEEFVKLDEELDLLCLPESEKEKKLIQVIDLFKFVECLSSSIEIINYADDDINIIKNKGLKAGIIFCDNLHFIHFNCNYQKIQFFKNKYQLDEIWFVYVLELNTDYSQKNIQHYIQKYNLQKYYNRTFLFNFFGSDLSEIK